MRRHRACCLPIQGQPPREAGAVPGEIIGGNRFGRLELEVLGCLLAEHVDDRGRERVFDLVAETVVGSVAVALLHHVDDSDDILAEACHVQVHRGAHHLGHIDRALEARAIRDAEREVLRTDAERDGLGLHVVGSEVGSLVLRHLDRDIAELDGVVSAGADEVGVEEVHLRHADEACDEEVRWVVEQLDRKSVV